MDFNEQCFIEERRILTRLNVRYSRAPEKRQEHWEEQAPRVPMDVADQLEKRRTRGVFTEFGITWNGRTGEQP